MSKNYNKFVLFGIIFTFILGTLLHFVYEWSGSNVIVGIFSPVNESVWEHLKLLYFPMSLWLLLGYSKFGKNNCNYLFFHKTLQIFPFNYYSQGQKLYIYNFIVYSLFFVYVLRFFSETSYLDYFILLYIKTNFDSTVYMLYYL